MERWTIPECNEGVAHHYIYSQFNFRAGSCLITSRSLSIIFSTGFVPSASLIFLSIVKRSKPLDTNSAHA